MFQKIFIDTFPILIVLLIFGLIFLYPSFLKEKEQKERCKKVKIDDKILTRGGICGKVLEVREKTFVLQSEKAVFEIEKNAVTEIL